MPIREAVPTSAVIAVLLSACGTADHDAPDTTARDRAVCLVGDDFVADGVIPVAAGETGDATRITALRWEAHDGCERFVIDLAAGGDSAARTIGSVRGEFLRTLGVVRVTLPTMAEVDADATDARFDGPLVRRAYVVRAPDGAGMYVDLHLGEAAEADLTILGEPARVVVDLRPGGDVVGGSPATHTRVVVVRPQGGVATYPLEITGYGRTFEANIVARLVHDGTDVAEQFTTATAWADAWGHYSLSIPSGPPGDVELHVGQHSARDGTWEGVRIPLTMR